MILAGVIAFGIFFEFTYQYLPWDRSIRVRLKKKKKQQN